MGDDFLHVDTVRLDDFGRAVKDIAQAYAGTVAQSAADSVAIFGAGLPEDARGAGFIEAQWAQEANTVAQADLTQLAGDTTVGAGILGWGSELMAAAYRSADALNARGIERTIADLFAAAPGQTAPGQAVGGAADGGEAPLVALDPNADIVYHGEGADRVAVGIDYNGDGVVDEAIAQSRIEVSGAPEGTAQPASDSTSAPFYEYRDWKDRGYNSEVYLTGWGEPDGRRPEGFQPPR